ncbi:MAG: dihydrofolate reductase [Aminipila sp.]
MKIIVAVDKNWGIGKDNGLLTYIPDDLKYFKEKTLDKVVVMGRRTLESLPGAKPLPKRTNIVLTSDKDYKVDCHVCHSTKELEEQLENYESDNVYIIGGAKVYKDFLSDCDTCFVTKIDKAFEPDRYFDNLDENKDFELFWESEVKEHNGIKYRFTEYRRK